MIYLDHNATAPVRAEAIEAISEALTLLGNASSVHRAGQRARGRLNDARGQIAAAIGLPLAGRIVFTSGGTEANHLALHGIGRPVIRSSVEHESVNAAAADAILAPVDPDGRVDLMGLERLLEAAEAPVLVSIMAANNETGVIQPIREIAALAHAAGALVHCDAVQAIGKIPFDMAADGIDLASLSAHKLGGPQGIGALAMAPHIEITAAQRGGGQEQGLRAGTENLPGILGFAAAIGPAIAELAGYAQLGRLRDRLETMLLSAIPDALIFAASVERLPNTSCVTMPGVGAETQIIALDLAGICVSAGAACSSGKVRSSHVLAAMGVAPEVARSAIRISLGRTTTEAEIDRCAEIWIGLAKRLGGTTGLDRHSPGTPTPTLPRKREREQTKPSPACGGGLGGGVSA